MNFDIWRGQIEFAKDLQYLFEKGWTFTHEYGEQRLGISDKMVFVKGQETFNVYDAGDLLTILRKEQDSN